MTTNELANIRIGDWIEGRDVTMGSTRMGRVVEVIQPQRYSGMSEPRFKIRIPMPRMPKTAIVTFDREVDEPDPIDLQDGHGWDPDAYGY